MGKRTIDDVEVQGKRVLMRVDYNVPVEDGVILDDRRIRASLESVRSVMGRGGRLILMSHLGRPRGDRFEPDLSLRPCAEHLHGLLQQPVGFASDCVGAAVYEQVDHLEDGSVLLLENLRFHKEEVLNNAAFARQLADLADIYCNEAFPAAHRLHASMVGVPRALLESDAGRSKAKVAGVALQRELRFLGDALAHPRRPFVAIVGGKSTGEKTRALLNMLDRLDVILVGGALAHTFMAAEHKGIGESQVDRTAVKDAARVLHDAAGSATRLILPAGHVCGLAPYPATPNRLAEEVIPEGWMGLDIGPRAVVQFVEIIRKAQTIFWTGPMGAIEAHPFDIGTKEIALAVAHATQLSGATSIVGGSDTTRLLQRMGLEGSVSHVTTGGAATLAMLEGQRLEAVELLDDRPPGLAKVPGVEVGEPSHGSASLTR